MQTKTIVTNENWCVDCGNDVVEGESTKWVWWEEGVRQEAHRCADCHPQDGPGDLGDEW